MKKEGLSYVASILLLASLVTCTFFTCVPPFYSIVGYSLLSLSPSDGEKGLVDKEQVSLPQSDEEIILEEKSRVLLNSKKRGFDIDFPTMFSLGEANNIELGDGGLMLAKDPYGNFEQQGYWISPEFDTQNEHVLWDWVYADVDFNGMQENLWRDQSFENPACYSSHYPNSPMPCSVWTTDGLLPPFSDDNYSSDGQYSLRIRLNNSKLITAGHISNRADFSITDFNKSKNLHILFDAKYNHNGAPFEYWLILGNDTDLMYNGAIQAFSAPMPDFEEQYFIINYSQLEPVVNNITWLGFRFFQYYQNVDYPTTFWLDNLRYYEDSPISYQVRTSSDGLFWTNWNDERYFFAKRTAPGGQPDRFIQFKISLKTGNITKTPKITKFHLDYSKAFEFNIPPYYDGSSIIDPLEAPSIDERGYTSIDNKGNIFFENGDLAKFWAAQVNDDSSYYIDSQEVGASVCKKIKQMGFNMIKVSPTDLADTSRWDKFDYFLKSCRDEGVYIYVQLNGGWPQGVNPYDYNARKQHMSTFMNHVNNYTNIAYKDDPQFVFVQLLNENRLFNQWYGNDSAIYSGNYNSALNQYWWQFLQENYPTFDSVNNAWSDGTGYALFEDEITNQANYPYNIKRIQFLENLGTFSDKRYSDTTRFYALIYNMYFNEMVDFLKNDVQIHSLIIPNNHYYGLADLKERTIADVMDQHPYYGYTRVLDFGEIMTQVPEVKAPFNNPITYTALNDVYGYPMTASESNYDFPNLYSIELPLFISAYFSFNDWDQWTYFKILGRNESQSSYNRVPEALESWYDPGRMAMMPSASRIFVNQYVAPARKIINLSYTNTTVYDFKHNKHLKNFNIPGLTNDFVYLHTLRRSDFDFNTKKTIDDYYNEYSLVDPESPYISDTGELILDYDKGYLVINSSMAQAYTGFTNDQKINLMNSEILIYPTGNNFSAISIVPLDDHSIVASNHLLLTAVGRTEASETQWLANKQGFVDDGYYLWNSHFGDEPVLVEGINAEISIKNGMGITGIYILNSSGQRTGDQVNYILDGSKAVFNISDMYETLWYEIVINSSVYESEQEINLQQGWNLVSINLTGDIYSSDFDSPIVIKYEDESWIMDFDGSNPFRLNPLQGYFVYSDISRIASLHGISLSPGVRYNLVDDSWNLFGVSYEDSFSSIYSDITSPVYGLFIAGVLNNQEISLIDNLVPGDVYWANLEGPGLSPPASKVFGDLFTSIYSFLKFLFGSLLTKFI